MARRRLTWLGCLVILSALGLFFYGGPDPSLVATRLNQAGFEVERRIQWWDWKDTAEEEYCWAGHKLPASKEKIPNVVHFVLLANEGKEAELSYARFLAIKAAILRMDGAEIKLHTYALNTSNTWWKKLEKHVTLVRHAHNELEGPHGLAMRELRLAHQADLFRLDILLREGGIYLDTDVYTLRPFNNLLTSPRDALMGHEGGNRYGLCNAVIVARPGSKFLSKWMKTYSTFNVNGWNEHSVQKPKQLQVQHPELICPLSPSVFFWPTWARTHVHYMYDQITAEDVASLKTNMTLFDGAMYANQLAIHAWAAHDRLAQLTEASIQTEDTRFNLLLREVAATPL